jgi:hypothetical protein
LDPLLLFIPGEGFSLLKFLSQNSERAADVRFHRAQGKIRCGRNFLMAQVDEKSERQ